jgi:HAE1 family hydrophobic/amphiphilic exporter-1
LVEAEIAPSLEGIEGIGSVTISGQQLKEVPLTFDEVKMSSLGISEDMVKGFIQGSAIQVPLGLFELNKTEKALVVDGGITTLDDLRRISIPLLPAGAGMNPGPAQPNPNAGLPVEIPSVQLQDIANIELAEITESISRTNGRESIGINISKSAATNTVDVVNAVKEEIAYIEKEYPGTKIVVMIDQGEPIEKSVHTMINKALFGALFAIIVILLFLRNIRTTIISIISIPLSLLMTLFILNQMGITLNMMTLGAMTVAIGRVVDDSIVVIENNYRRMKLRTEKLKGKALVLDATREMFMPILSSTLVTIAVFVPLGTVDGPIGELFMPFALTMVFALLASLVVAVTIVPMLTHLMFRKSLLAAGEQSEEKPGIMASRYRKLLNWSLNHKWITSIAAVILLGSSLLLVVFGMVGVSFLPEEEEKYAMVTYSPGAGQLFEDVEQTALAAEELILNREGVKNLQYSVGGHNPFSPGPSKSALFYVQYENDTENFAEVKEMLIHDLASLDSEGSWGAMDFGGGFGGSQLTLFVYGDSMEEIEPAVAQIVEVLSADESLEKVESSITETYDQYTLIADQQKLSQLGLTAGQIVMELSSVRNRPVLTEVQIDGNQYQVYINVEQEQYSSIEDIENVTITSPLGIEVPLSELVQIEEGHTAGSVTRKDGKLFAQVTADIIIKDIGKASSDAQNKVNALEFPSSITVDFGGVTEQLEETFTQLGMAMAAAVAIVYLLLVITFGGAITPFVILFSLPFIVIGALVGLFAAGETISAPAMMGALMLIGIVVTNAIVLIDRVIHKEKEGLSTRDALLEATGTRLRPILMTALATIGALLPLALGFEGTEGSLISKGLGVTVIGGLLSSTLLTLVIVPVVYEFFAKFRKYNMLEE